MTVAPSIQIHRDEAPAGAPPPPPLRPTPAPRLDAGLAATWRHDLGAGIVVFLVALPLCLGIALASGAPLLSGLVTGIVGGVVVSRLSGSQLLVSGPAAGLSAIVLAAIAELGSFEVFLVAVVIGGALQLALGAARAGIIGYFFPSSVIRGMLAAIGLILILKQIPYALGVGGEVFESDSFAAQQGGNTFTALATAARAMAPLAVAISLLSLAVMLAWPRLAPAALRRIMPAPLATVLLGVGLSMAATAFAPGIALPAEAMVQLPVVGSPKDLIGLLSFPDWSAITRADVWRVGLTIALVASLESLLSLEATDKLDPYKRTSPANRELFAQGAGNMLAGLAGGLPMTGVIVRSAANVNAGGRTWRSAFFHGILLLVAVVAIPALLNRIPLATLAAILLFTGFTLAHPRQFRQAWHIGPQYFAPFVITVVAILLTDLLIGIIIGLTVGAFFILYDSYRTAYSYQLEESADHHRVRLTLAEEVTFLNKARINEALQQVPDDSVVTVDAGHTKHIDYDVVEMLHDFLEGAKRRGIRVKLIGVPALKVARATH
jgi:MFS superfamily sulfate permease-like transporter